MDAKRPDKLVAWAEMFITPDEGHIEVTYAWSDANYKSPPPPDDTIAECFRHAVGARDALVRLAAAAWGTPPASLLLSSPQFLRRPSGNNYKALVRWEMVGAVPSCWGGLDVFVSFRDPYLLISLAPHRFDVFITPWVSHPMASSSSNFDTSQAGLERVSERLEAMRGSLAELLAIMYQQNVVSVELAIPRWEEDCVTYEGGAAFKVAGILRIAGHEPLTPALGG